MNIMACYQLLLILTSLAIHFSEQIKFINDSSSIDVCKGKDVHFIFKVDEEENKIKRLEWYFNNNTVICTSDSPDDFTVKPLYQGRIERIGRTGIQLKNVSIDDEGIYMLLPLNPWSATEIRVKIKLRVLEPPTNKCTCNASTSEQTESYCGRPQVSCVWKRKQTFEVLQDGNHIMKSIFEDKELLCCQDGEAMKCVDDKRQFCTTVSLYHKDNDRSSEDGSTQRTDSVTIPGTDTGSTSIIHTLLVFTNVLLISVIVFRIICKMRLKNKDLKKNVPMMEMNSELHEAANPLIKDDPRLETKEAITVLQPRKDSEADIEVQMLQPSTLCLNISHCPFATIRERIMILFCFISSSANSVSGQHPPKKNEQNEHLIEMNSELHEAGNPLIKDDPGLETIEAITVHQPTNDSEADPGLKIEVTVDQPMNDSEANSEVQALQPSTSYPALEIKANVVHQPMNDSEACSKVQSPTPYPALEIKANVVHQPMNDLEAWSKVQPSTLYPRLETIAIIVHHLLKDLEASSKVQPPTP